MSDAACPPLQAENLSCTRNDLALFRGFSCSLQPGETIQIDGPNGCGKTSLLRILCGLALAETGRVLWQGREIGEDAPAYLAAINYIGHQNGLKLELTPRENLEVACRLAFSANGGAETLAALETFGLAGYEDTPARMLSSGQRRRAALARLLLHDAALWVLDEPFTSVDDAGRKLIEKVIERHVDNGGMLILATHEPINITTGKFTRLLLNEWK